MKTLRKLIVFIVVASMLLSCGGKKTTVVPPTNTSAPAATATVAQAVEPSATMKPAEPTATTKPAEPTATTKPVEPTATTEMVEPTATTPPVTEGPYVNYLFTTVDDYKAFSGKSIDTFHESPMLTDEVNAGTLPPLDQRLPQDVSVIRTREGDAAQYGGEFHLVGVPTETALWAQFLESMPPAMRQSDPKAQHYYPGIVKGYQLSDDFKTLTINLRRGMKWSDGVAFNADDFVFWYEDILKNTDLNPDIDPIFKPGGELMGLNKVDDYTVEYTFAAPYPLAIEKVLGGIYAPAHYLKQFLPKYNPDADANAKAAGFDTWVLQWASLPSYYSNPDVPTLNAWVVSEISASSVLWKRNPYFWRVDTNGNQLPYVDTLLVTPVADSTALPAKVMAGEDDWESQGLAIADYPVLKQNEAQGKYKVYLWPDGSTSFALGFALNYTVKDPVLRQIFWDLRFRQALSLAINRDDISQTIFSGLTVPWTAPVSASWTGYEDWMGTYYAEHDVAKANALLDDMGLQWDSAHQYRLRPDGQTLTILGEHSLDWLGYVPDLLQIVVANWADIGVKLDPKFVPDEQLMLRYAANEQQVGIFNSDGGQEPLARAAYPIRLEPPWHWMGTDCCAMSSYPWRLWWDTTQAGGTPQGEEPPQEIKDLFQLVKDWLNTPAGTPEYTTLINQIITINVENLYYFGTVSAPPRVVAITDRIGNLPGEDGIADQMFAPFMPEVVFIRP